MTTECGTSTYHIKKNVCNIKKKKLNFRLRDFGDIRHQPRSQGTLLPVPRKEEDPGNEVDTTYLHFLYFI